MEVVRLNEYNVLYLIHYHFNFLHLSSLMETLDSFFPYITASKWPYFTPFRCQTHSFVFVEHLSLSKFHHVKAVYAPTHLSNFRSIYKWFELHQQERKWCSIPLRNWWQWNCRLICKKRIHEYSKEKNALSLSSITSRTQEIPKTKITPKILWKSNTGKFSVKKVDNSWHPKKIWSFSLQNSGQIV